MRPSWACVDVSQNVTVSFVEYAMNFPCCGRAMHERGTGHSETVEPVDASTCLIVLPDTTKRWLFNQRRPVLRNGVTFTGMCTSKWPLLLSQTRTESLVAVAIRSPCGEYFATVVPCLSVSTFLRVRTSQMEGPMRWSFFPTTSRVESGEKSTARMSLASLCVKTFSNVSASHTDTSPSSVPAAIHLPSFDTARERTPRAAIVAICLPSSTRHTPSPSPPPTIYSPFAENATAHMLWPLSILMSVEPSCSTVSINATEFHQYPPVIVNVVISDTVAEQW